jgi:hypothetical protein
VSGPPLFEDFKFPHDDPLADEHAAVAAWIEDAFATLDQYESGKQVDLKTLPSGQMLLGAKPEQSRRYALAAVAQARHWDQQAEKLRARGTTAIERMNPGHLPGWHDVWCRRRQAAAAVDALMRRSLPFEKDDLVAILRWCDGAEELSKVHFPIGHISRALERYASETRIDLELRSAMTRFAARLRSSPDNEAKRHATAVEQLCVDGGAEPMAEPAPHVETRPAPMPAPAGTAAVMTQLKRMRGMPSGQAAPSTTLVEPDRFPLRADSPLRQAHELFSSLLEEAIGVNHHYDEVTLNALLARRAIFSLDPSELARLSLAAAERHVHALLAPSADLAEGNVWQCRHTIAAMTALLLKIPFELKRDGSFDLLLYISARPAHERAAIGNTPEQLIAQAANEASVSPLTEGERYVLSLFRASLISGPPLGAPSENVARLSRLINDGAGFYLVPGETWSDAVNDDISRLPAAERLAWSALFRHALTATAARPTARWLAAAEKLAGAIATDLVEEALMRWLPLVTRGPRFRRLSTYAGDLRSAGDVMNEENATCLRGLLWLIQKLPRPDELAHLITSVALSAYKKVPGIGPRAVKVGNAAVYALSESTSSNAVGQLALLKVRVRFGTAQKEIDKAFTTAALALGLPRDQIEEMAVPTYGLEEVGVRRESIVDCRAELIVAGSDASLKWFSASGTPLKSVPSRVKTDYKEDLQELSQSLKDIKAMLAAQRDRLDSIFLLRKSWSLDEWRERYLEHPLVGTIARRLIWCVDSAAALFVDGQPTSASGATIEYSRTARITLWHPVERSTDEITAWRTRLEDLGITQPFKQAHREIYLLTDAERHTGTYSNRFAAHIIRQHQFNALCGARGWKNELRLMVDAELPPAFKELPQWGLRAEFWIEGVGQDYGTDTNDSGVFMRLATDHVRFHRLEAAQNAAHAGGGGYDSQASGPGEGGINQPVPLDLVPPLVFSEIMRDVDLFIGVASVGNDPTWQDGGPQGRYRDYWQTYSFGELSGTATTRKQVLERLVPRLKIADRCSFSERFLIVRGQKRTYKIHLGSGNVLMEPNDQYLCIVPDSRSKSKQDDLYLPFEGDGTLSIILSKALLLADDAKIKDPTIARQIDNR